MGAAVAMCDLWLSWLCGSDTLKQDTAVVPQLFAVLYDPQVVIRFLHSGVVPKIEARRGLLGVWPTALPSKDKALNHTRHCYHYELRNRNSGKRFTMVHCRLHYEGQEMVTSLPQ